MSQSKLKELTHLKERGSSSRPVSSLFNSPILEGRFDRFCTTCSGVIENMALERYRGLSCTRCGSEVECLDNPDGNFRRCVRCCVFVKCKLNLRKINNFDMLDRLNSKYTHQKTNSYFFCNY